MQKQLHTAAFVKRGKNYRNFFKDISGRSKFNTFIVRSLLVIASVFAVGNVSAQVVDYTMIPSSGTFTPLTGGTTVATIQADDAMSGAIPIGFTFNFDGTNYTDIYANSNGWISFNPGSTAVTAATSRGNALATIAAANRPLLAPLWDDLDGSATGGSTASYQTTGAAGSRVFTFEWLNWEYNWQSNTPVISFQVKLYETSNKIEFIYRSETGNVNAGSASVGIAGAATGAGNYLSLNNFSTSPTVSSTTETTNISTKPATGQIYTFNPPVSTPIDIQAVSLASPLLTGCFGSSQTVSVTIKNKGTAALNFATNPVTINASVSGTNPTTFPAVTVNTGTLAPNATQDVVITTTYNMSASGNYTFNATATVTGDGNATNNAIPATTITNFTLNTFPAVENFETFTPNQGPAAGINGWTGNTTGYRWQNEDGPVSSTGTGPAVDHTTGTAAGKYVYTESSTGAAGDAAEFISPCINLNGQTAMTMEFWYHMFGATIGTLNVDVFNGTTWIDGVWTMTGQQQTATTDPWVKASVNLTPYVGSIIKVRFRGIRGTSFTGDIAVDDVKFFVPTPTDIQATAFVSPASTGCYTAAQQVTVTVTNSGTGALNFATNPLTVTINVTGANTQTINTTVNTGTLAPGATQNVVVGNINMGAAGTYTINGTTALTGDGDASNNTFPTITRIVTPIRPLSQVVGFNGFTGSNLTTVYPNWYEATGATVPSGTTSAWTSSAAAQTTAFGTTTAKINLDAASDREWIVGPKITPTASTILSFKAAITDAGLATADATGMTGTDDVVQVMVSTDCGATFTPIFTYDATTTPALTEVLTEKSISLASYAGQNIIVAFFASEGTVNDLPSYDFHIDDIFIGTPPTVDVTATAFVNPAAAGCYTAAENVTVTIKNTGIAPINFANNNATVRLSVNGGNMITSPVLNSGTLAVGATQNISVGNINMSAAGTYNLMAIATVAGDTEAYNDTIRTSRTVTPIIALPVTNNFTGFTGGNLTTVFPNWYEATGATTPSGTTSAWTSSAAAQTTHFGSTTARINFPTAAATIRNEWIVGPKVTVTTATHLKFKAAVTSSGGITAATMGAGDSVLVMYSTNCGVSFSRLASLDASDNLSITMQAFDLNVSSLAGQNVIFAFKAINPGTRPATTYDLHIDDVEIRNMFANDISPVSIIAPKSVCRTTAEQICVIVQNMGTATLSNIPVSYRVNNGTFATGTIPGPLAAGDTVRHCFATTANLNAAGNYTLTVVSNLSGDNFMANDTLRTTVSSLTSTVASTAPAAICGPGTVNLTATSNNPSATIKWYTSATATTPVATGATYSPTVSATTTYYVEAGTSTESAGKASTTGADGKNTTGGLLFNVTTPIILNSVVVYTDIAAGGNLTVNLRNSANAIINTATVTLPPVTAMTPVTVPLNFNIPVGTGYLLENGSGTNLFRDSNGNTYPMTSPSGAVSITDGTVAGFYYYFFNWSITLGCPSARIPVVATVNSIPTTPTITASGFTLTSSAASGNQWYLNGNPITGATGTTYTAVANGTYTVVSTVNGCASAASAAFNINNVGISKDMAGRSVVVFPNPTNGQFEVKLNGFTKDATIALYNITGQLIATETVEGSAKESVKKMNVANLATGVYLLKVTSETSVQVSRLTVE